MFVNLPGVKSAGGAGESSDAEPVCEECSQAKNLIHCIDASIQVDLSDAEDGGEENAMGRKGDHDGRRSVIPMYSREDIREQYCINDKELQVLDNKRKKGLLGCFSDNGNSGISPCTKHGKRSILTSCIGKSGSEDDLSSGNNGNIKRPVSPNPGKPGNTWTGHRQGYKDEDDGFDDNYFRRRPKSFYFEGRRMCGEAGSGLRMSHVNIADENYFRSMTMGYPISQRPPVPCPPSGPAYCYSVYSPAMTRPEMFLSQDTLTSQHTTQPNTPDLLLHRKAVNDSEVSLDDRKQKHVSFDSSSILRSQTVGNMTEAENHHQQQPPTPSKSSERLLDGRKTPDYVLYSELFTPELARQIVLDRLKRSSMRTQATQTDVKKSVSQAKGPGLNPQHQAQQHNSKVVTTSPRLQKKACMVSESVQTNGLISPPGHLMTPSLNQPPPHWFTSLNRPHHQRNGGHGGYQVQVYNLDIAPTEANSNFSPPRTSTPLNSVNQSNGKRNQLSHSKVSQDYKTANQSCPSLEIEPRQFTNHQKINVKHPSNYSENKSRSLSSDNILEPMALPPLSSTQVLSDEEQENFNKIHITSENESKRTRLRKSVSSDVILSGIRTASCEDRQELSVDDLLDHRDCLRQSPGYQDTTESDLPELAPVILNIEPDVPASLAAHGQEGAFSASGANGSIISCNTEKEELNHKISKEFFEELSCSKAAKNNNFHGSYSSITETAETTGANSDTVTWTESQVTVLSADVGVGATDKISPSSLATSFGRTESLSSEHLFKVESDGCASSKDCDFKPINSDFEPIGDIAGGVADNSETQHDEKIVLTEYEIVHRLGRSNSVKLEIKKTKRPTLSLPDELALTSASYSLIENICASEQNNFNQNSPHVPFNNSDKSSSSRASNCSEMKDYVPCGDMADVKMTAQDDDNITDDVKSPMFTEPLMDDVKSPVSEGEVSSSSGSYSVTSVSKDTEEGGSAGSVITSGQERLELRKCLKSGADFVISETMREEREQETSIIETEPVVQQVQDILESSSDYNSSNQANNNEPDWTDSDKTQRKMCLKLNLSKDVIKEENNLEQDKHSFCERFTENEKNNGTVRKGSMEGSFNSKLTKTPSSIPRELIGESYTPSPTLARSPAMHEGFRSKDWKVERTPIATPDSNILTSRLPQLSDDEEEIEETESVRSETDPISKESGTSSFLPSSVDASESRTGSLIPEKELPSRMHLSEVCQSSPTTLPDQQVQNFTENLPPLAAAPAVPSEEDSALVKPPAGFTDSPVKNLPPSFLASEIIDDSVNEVLTAENEILILEPLENVDANPPLVRGGQEAKVFSAVLENQKSRTGYSGKENLSSNDSYHHPELVICQRQELPEVMSTSVQIDRKRNNSSSGAGSRSSSKGRQKSRSRSRSKSSERILLADNNDTEEFSGCYFGEYQKQAWVFVGEITSSISTREIDSGSHNSLKRSASIESTQSEKEFSKKYQAITHRMVHRKSSAIMYSRILDRTFECNKTVTVQRLDGEFGFRIHGSRPVVVSAIEPGTPAETSGLTVGDILLTINGVNVLDLPHTQVVRVAQRCSEALELGVARMDDVMERASVWQQLDMAKEVLAQGYLYKKKRTSNSQSSQHQHHWVTRWFVLRADDCLYSFKSENDTRPSGAVLLPGCVIKQLDIADRQDPVLAATPRYCLQVFRPDSDSGASSIWLAADSETEFAEWKEMLHIAANKRRSQDDMWLEVSRQRSSIPASGHTNPDCRGHLHQYSAGSWIRQLLVLIDGCLYIYSDIEPDAPAIGVIYLHGYKAQPSSIAGRRHAWEMIPTEQSIKHFYFHAQTETEKKRWLAALEYSIDRWMRLS